MFKIHHIWLIVSMLYTHTHRLIAHIYVFYELRSHYKITWKYAEHEHLHGVKCYIYICDDYMCVNQRRKNAFVFMNMLVMVRHYMHTVLNSLVEVPKVLVFFQKKKEKRNRIRAIPKAMNKLEIIIKSLNYNHSNTPSLFSSIE